MVQVMRRIGKRAVVLALACLCLACMPLESLAATKPINSVSVKVSSKLKAGDTQPGISIGGSAADGEVQVSSSGSYYTVTDG